MSKRMTPGCLWSAQLQHKKCPSAKRASLWTSSLHRIEDNNSPPEKTPLVWTPSDRQFSSPAFFCRVDRTF